MPFNPSTGVYTPPNGATNAFPGEVIQSAIWNAVFTDISTALTQLGQGQISTVQLPRIINTAGSFTVTTTDRIILVTAPAGTIFLPAAATKVNPVTIIGDAGTIFGSNNAIVLPNGVETIVGLGTYPLNGNYQSITLLPLSTGGWLIG